MICQVKGSTIRNFNKRGWSRDASVDIPVRPELFYGVMKRNVLPVLLLVMVITLCLLPAPASPFGGPLQVRNEFPLFLPINAPFMETAAYDHSLSVDFSYSSVYMVRSSAAWSVNLDMEIAELNFRYRRDILNLLELGIEVPFLSFNSGFMDDFLSKYHKTFGFSDYGRSGRPSNSFLYEVRRNGVAVIRADGGKIGIGDVRITAKRTLLSDDPVVSLMADLELPTGSASNGFGSGSIDAGVALLAEKKLSEKIKAYLNLGAIFPGDFRARETVALKNFIYGGFCLEADVSNHVSLIGQVFAQGSPFPKTGISSVDRTAVLLSLGGRYVSGKDSFELSFTEDPNTAGAPDFTITLAYRKRF
jgi:hypothetical protein